MKRVDSAWKTLLLEVPSGFVVDVVFTIVVTFIVMFVDISFVVVVVVVLSAIVADGVVVVQVVFLSAVVNKLLVVGFSTVLEAKI